MRCLRRKLTDREETERITVLDWLSDVPFGKHHTNNREGRLPKSGQWLMEKELYKTWRGDASSSVLWLLGIGKPSPLHRYWQRIVNIVDMYSWVWQK
jgi:hypothetical protein